MYKHKMIGTQDDQESAAINRAVEKMMEFLKDKELISHSIWVIYLDPFQTNAVFISIVYRDQE